jgi:hypothetical protein
MTVDHANSGTDFTTARRHRDANRSGWQYLHGHNRSKSSSFGGAVSKRNMTVTQLSLTSSLYVIIVLFNLDVSTQVTKSCMCLQDG